MEILAIAIAPDDWLVESDSHSFFCTKAQVKDTIPIYTVVSAHVAFCMWCIFYLSYYCYSPNRVVASFSFGFNQPQKSTNFAHKDSLIALSYVLYTYCVCICSPFFCVEKISEIKCKSF